MTTIEGGCLCGRVRFRLEGEPLASMACHCRDCQYLSGGAEANVVAYSRASFTLLSGDEKIYRSPADSGTVVWRSFCPECGTPLFAGNDKTPDFMAVKVGTLDDPAHFRRMGHIWTDSAPPWHLMEPDLPTARKNPEFL
jgi:hypothetical protein